MNRAARTVSDTAAGTPATLVYGLGGTGLSAARYLKRKGIDALYLDSRAQPPGLGQLRELLPDAEVMLGDFDESRLEHVERCLVSPGIPECDAMLIRLRRAGVDVVSDIDIFVEECRADFVAVTGSNGKSTVTTLIARMCDAAGRKALPGGNLGHAALDLLAEEPPAIYVLELSSFQLQRTRSLPAAVAVLLNVSPDHLDWHIDEAEYRAAKHRIYAQASAAVFNRDEPGALAAIPEGIPSISFGLDVPGDDHFGLAPVDGQECLVRGKTRLMPASDLALVGRHNIANALAALAAGTLIGLPSGPMLEVLRTFSGLPHRMQFVAELDGVRYINDSKATNVGAAIASVLSVDGPVVLLAGGQGKGGDFDSLADAVAGKLRAVVVFGEDAGRLETAFAGRAETVAATDLGAALAEARRRAAAGDTVLLAPACASFDQFDNYLARGDAFARMVGEIGS